MALCLGWMVNCQIESEWIGKIKALKCLRALFYNARYIYGIKWGYVTLG